MSTETPATTHTPILEPWTIKGAERGEGYPAIPDRQGTKIKCADADCFYSTYTTTTDEETARKWFYREHGEQYTPGRAPNITVEWEISAYCSVCPRGSGDIQVVDSEVIECKTCGTTWAMDGSMGERKQDDG